jgi:hypothetical protein
MRRGSTEYSWQNAQKSLRKAVNVLGGSGSTILGTTRLELQHFSNGRHSFLHQTSQPPDVEFGIWELEPRSSQFSPNIFVLF